MAEKRRIGRIRKRLQLRFGTASATTLGFTDDISSDGLFIRSTSIVPPQSVIVIEIAQEPMPIVLSGRVMWARKVPANMAARIKGGMGIRILAFTQGEELFRRMLE